MIIKQIKSQSFLVALIVFLVSCKNESVSPRASRGKALSFVSSSMEGISTRAIANTWEAEDEIGVFMKRTEDKVLLAENKKYISPAADGIFNAVTGNEIFPPADAKAVDFFAYYPFKKLANNIYPVDLNDQSNPSAIDLMYSGNELGFDKFETAQPQLKFVHQLAMLEIVLKAGQGIASVSESQVLLKDCLVSAGFDLLEGAMGAGQTTADVKAKMVPAGTLQKATFLLLPGNYSGKELSVNLSSGQSFTWKFPTNAVFGKAKKYSYNVTVNDPSATDKINLLVDVNYEDGSLTSGHPDLTLSLATAKDAEYIVSPGATGKYAVAHKVTVGDEAYFSNNNWRSEAATSRMFETGKYYNGDERRFEISILLKDWQPYSSAVSDQGDIIFQGKQNVDINPAWYLMTKRNQIAFRLADHQIQVPVIQDYRPYINQWIHYRIDAKMSNLNDGYYKVYCKLPGQTSYQLKYELKNIATFNPSDGTIAPSGYLKWGLYRPGASLLNNPPDVLTRVIYHDDLRIYKLN